MDIATYLQAVEDFETLFKAGDARAIASYVYAELEVGHDPKTDHAHNATEAISVMRRALLAYAGSIEHGWGAGRDAG